MGGNKKNKNRNKKKNRQNANQVTHYDEVPEDKSESLQDEENISDPHDDNVNASQNSDKRHHDDDSDHEDQPKKKKKKKQPVTQDTTDKRGKKSIRQMKKEKFAQRQAEAQAAAKDQLKSQCLNYLSQWKHDKLNWKFMKVKQGWLNKNKFSTHLLPESSWPLLLEYFESAQGNIRKLLLEDAHKVIKQMDEWTESNKEQTEDKDDEENNEDSETTSKCQKPDINIYKRARDLIQCLEE